MRGRRDDLGRAQVVSVQRHQISRIDMLRRFDGFEVLKARLLVRSDRYRIRRVRIDDAEIRSGIGKNDVVQSPPDHQRTKPLMLLNRFADE